MHAVNVAMVNAIQTLSEQNQIQQELILDLHAQVVSLQAQMRVLQGQMAGVASHGQVALGR